MAENSKQKYNNFLREEVNKYCNENGCYEIYFDYRDEISPKYLLEEFENYQNDKKNYIKFKSYLTEKIYEDYYYDYDYSLYDTIQEDIYRTNDRDIIDEYLATEDFYEDLTSAGYKGINFDIKDLLRNSRLCVNVMFGTDKERNFDMGSIVSSYGNDYQTPFEDWSVNEEDYDKISQDDELELRDVIKSIDKGSFTLIDKTKNIEIELDLFASQEQKEMLKKGGRLNLIRN